MGKTHEETGAGPARQSDNRPGIVGRLAARIVIEIDVIDRIVQGCVTVAVEAGDVINPDRLRK